MHPLVRKLKIPFVIFLVCVVAYFPLSSFLFALKNDALIYNLPPKIFFSEAIQYGHFPIWNPYLNFGYPIYADPGFAWWHPLTWLFGVIGYNAYTLHIELLLYIYIAGMGMYWLCRKLTFQKQTALSVGCMFMCSGFFIGNLQHINFVTCAAFLPWVVGFWILYQNNGGFRNLLGFAIATYLLCTGGHPAIPIATAFFFFIITLLYFFLNIYKENLKTYIWRQLQLLIGAFVILLPIIISYLTILPFYVRSEPVDQSLNLNTGFSLQSYISFLLPFATIKNYDWFATDVSMRNAYFSIPGIIFFIIFLKQKQKTKFQKVFLIAGIIMLIMSAGGSIKELLYKNLALFSLIKTNGEFRVFAIFSFLVCSSFTLEEFFQKNLSTVKHFKKTIKYLIGIATLITIYILIIHQNKVFTFIETFTNFSINGLKNLIGSIDFLQSFLISLILFVILSISYLLLLNKGHNPKVFIAILFLDMIINSWMLLPITGVGSASVQDVQSILNKFPEGFPSPLSTRIQDANLSMSEKLLIGDVAWYSKRIEFQEINYPSNLKSTDIFFRSSDTIKIKGKPFVFFKNNNGNTLYHMSFTPAASTFQLNILEKDTIIILQNYALGWNARKNHKPVSLSKYISTFIAIPVDVKDTSFAIKFLPFINQ